jgi:EpsI family protein
LQDPTGLEVALARDWASARAIAGFRGGFAPLVALMTALAFWPVTGQLLALWMDTDRPYSHGLLLGPLSAWLILSACRARPDGLATSWSAVTALAGLTMFWAAAFAIDILIAQQALFPALLILSVASVFGWTLARKLFFPIGLLWFAIPVWTVLVPLLQSTTVVVVQQALDVVGIPVYVEGNLITIPEGTFEIAGGCAGLHYFLVALTCSSLYGYLHGVGLAKHLYIIAFAGVLAMLTNWIRVASLVVIGHRTAMQHYLIAEDHYYYGWVLFAGTLGVFFYCARLLVRQSEGHGDEPPSSSVAPVRARDRWNPAVLALFAAVLSLPIAIVTMDALAARATIGPVKPQLPSGVEGWAGPEQSRNGWVPRYVGVSGETVRSYSRAGGELDVYVGVYKGQAQGAELISSDNSVLGPQYARVAASRLSLEADARVDDVAEVVGKSSTGQLRLVWYWYVIGGHSTANETAAKLWQLSERLMGHETAAIIALSARCDARCDEERVMFLEFAAVMGMALEATVVAAQNSS